MATSESGGRPTALNIVSVPHPCANFSKSSRLKNIFDYK